MEDLVQIPPATSPLLLPTTGHRRPAPPASALRERRRHGSSDSFHQLLNQDIPEDLELEFMAPGDYTERDYDDDEDTRSGWSYGTDREGDDGEAAGGDDDDDDDDDDDIGDFTLEDGHIEGVPSCNQSLAAKQYHTEEFSASLLELLRDDLQVPGWAELPVDLPASAIHIHKVSGSLTNAVFFVSVPETVFELHLDHGSENGAATPPLSTADQSSAPLSRATVLSELEKGRASTPTPKNAGSQVQFTPSKATSIPTSAEPVESVSISAPTLLLRIYGPSSGSLISRRTELHILHTLSSSYQIGPRVLGTFANGRVEEYFHSRALHKDEMRDERISRWIGRRMRELHSVRLDEMVPLGGPERKDSSSRPERPSLEHSGACRSSSASIYSHSSGSSIFSFGASSYSNSSAGSYVGSYSGSMDGSQFGTPIVSSPQLLPRQASESRAGAKKRSRGSSITSLRSQRSKDRLGVWENMTRWTREAKIVLKALDELASMPGFDSFFDPPPPSPMLRPVDAKSDPETPTATPPNDGSGATNGHGGDHVPPLSSPMRTFALRAALNLPLFEQQVKLYRQFVREWEKREGKSKRVFSHNDTQYGNLLLLTPAESLNEGEDDVKALERSLAPPHHKIIVVDFEYASANPRAFDIANHFIEWQADYHHPTLSHSLATHGKYPNRTERYRFLRAYVGCDLGRDTSLQGSSSSLMQDGSASPLREDVRVLRLDEEVRVWEPSSHAMWAVWGIVQAKEDLLAMVEKWKKACRIREQHRVNGVTNGVGQIKIGSSSVSEEGRPVLRRGKSGEIVNPEVADEEEIEDTEMVAVDFDYLSYALGRMDLFRRELKALGIVE